MGKFFFFSAKMGEVLLPGAYYEKMDLENFEFQIRVEEGAAYFSFQLETKEIPPKRAKGDSADEDNEEEGSDWASKEAWDNYGPGLNIEWDFGELATKAGFVLPAFPAKVEFQDDEDE